LPVSGQQRGRQFGRRQYCKAGIWLQPDLGSSVDGCPGARDSFVAWPKGKTPSRSVRAALDALIEVASQVSHRLRGS